MSSCCPDVGCVLSYSSDTSTVLPPQCHKTVHYYRDMCLRISTFRIRRARFIIIIFSLNPAQWFFIWLDQDFFFFFFSHFPAMKSEMSAEEAQLFQWQFDKMRHNHIILPQTTHTNMHTCTVSSMTVQDSITTLNTKHCTLWNSIVAVWRASASLTLDVNLTANLWQQTLSEKACSKHTHTHAHARAHKLLWLTQNNPKELLQVNKRQPHASSESQCGCLPLHSI